VSNDRKLGGVVGPNAIIQVRMALGSALPASCIRAIFHQAGVARFLETVPQSMVPETDVIALHDAVVEMMGPQAPAVLRAAGTATAAYILAHRLPKIAQAVLKRLPRAVASRALSAAISRHAWTFAGSNRFSWTQGRNRVSFEIAPGREAATLPRDCAFYEGVFEGLFGPLVCPHASASEVANPFPGASRRFDVRW
jgi:divinyl protochlorophyllide a 8-vinyl-reductase